MIGKEHLFITSVLVQRYKRTFPQMLSDQRGGIVIICLDASDGFQ